MTHHTKIKMCGMMRTGDILALNKIRPDYAGCILGKGFRRTITEEQAAAFRQLLNPSIPLIGVFVNDPVERITAIVHKGIISGVQLHGSEDNGFIDALKAQISVPIIQAFRVKSMEDILLAEDSHADYVLLDAGTGSGKSFDWSLACSCKRHFFLAGGLTPDNVAAAIAQTHPYGVDVSSGIETDGHKDRNKMLLFKEVISCQNQKDASASTAGSTFRKH